jgi:hypothetical protein
VGYFAAGVHRKVGGILSGKVQPEPQRPEAGHIIAIPNITRKCAGGKVKSATETEVKGNIEKNIEVAAD